MIDLFRDLLKGQDQTTNEIQMGISLNMCSRHRPDLDMSDPLASLERFKDPRLTALFKFAEGMDEDVMNQVCVYVTVSMI